MCVAQTVTLNTLQFVCRVILALNTDRFPNVTKRLIFRMVALFSVRYEIFSYMKIGLRRTKVVGMFG